MLRVAEKVPISTHATVGIYSFRTKKIALNAIDAMITADDRFNGEFYLCPAFNYVDHKKASPSTKMWGLGTPDDLWNAVGDPAFVKAVEKLKRFQ